MGAFIMRMRLEGYISRRWDRWLLLPAAILFILSAASCSNKKNTAFSRQWQAFNTRYNVYYNGEEHYKETLKAMEAAYEDDYTRTLLTHPAEARADKKAPQPSGDFKRTIEKMQKAIQLHSIKKKPPKKGSSKKEKEFRAREEFNPFLHSISTATSSAPPPHSSTSPSISAGSPT